MNFNRTNNIKIKNNNKLNNPNKPNKPNNPSLFNKTGASSKTMLAFDKSMRSFDQDGRMHVAVSNISKAMVCPYKGSEIPNSVQLGLDQNRVYNLLRDADELQRAAATFNNMPLLIEHIPVSADAPRRDLIVGTTGSDVRYEHPYLRCSLSIWDAQAIAGIESEEQTELSSAYHYDPDMTAGVYEGEPYDGVMRNLRGNHVALVDLGRAGRDVVVSDRDPFFERSGMKKLKAGAKPRISAAVDALNKKLALGGDIQAQDVATLVGALNGEVDDASASSADPTGGGLNSGLSSGLSSDDDLAADVDGVVEFLQGKLSDDDLDTVTKMLSGQAADDDLDDDSDGSDDSNGADPLDDSDDDSKSAQSNQSAKSAKSAKNAKNVKNVNGVKAVNGVKGAKPAQDRAVRRGFSRVAMDSAIAIAVKRARAEATALAQAKKDVAHLVGDVAMDSAEAVYKFTLEQKGVNVAGVHSSAYRSMVGMLRQQARPLGMDSKSSSDAMAMFPHLTRIGKA